MPKKRNHIAHAPNTVVRRSFRIGNRRSGESAHGMTSARLEEIVSGGGKQASKAAAVLRRRNNR